MMHDIKKQLHDIALNCAAEISITESQDYIECRLVKDNIDIDVDIPLHDGKFVAYGITSSILPRELYDTEIKNGYTEAQRSAEVLNNVEQILNKTPEFHSKPSIFNKRRGYIILPIDGKEQKIFLKENYFNFPSA